LNAPKETAVIVAIDAIRNLLNKFITHTLT
jgi:hypothetical protein